MSISFPYGRQSIGDAEVAAVTAALREPMITRGPQVKEFEEALANLCQARFAVLFNSASSALEAAYFAAEATKEDVLFSTPNTFVSTVGSACKQGVRPVLVDIDRTTGNLDLEKLFSSLQEHRQSRGKKFIVPVHFAGIAVDMERIADEVKDPSTVIIEDAAHAIGSHYRCGAAVGSCCYSDMTIFSFHPLKTITTGEGGAVLTNNPRFAHRLGLFRNNGIERDSRAMQAPSPGNWWYEVNGFTGNYHLTDLQAALGRVQLGRLSSFVERRRRLMRRYRQRISHAKQEGIALFSEEADNRTAFHIAVVQIDFTRFTTTRQTVMEKLLARGIGTQVHYIPIYRHPHFISRYGDQASFFPAMEQYYAEALTLPLYYDLAVSEVDRIVDHLLAILGDS